MRVTVDIKGGHELERTMARLEKHTYKRSAARAALKAGGEPIAKAARRLAPDDPSTSARDLKNSIAVSTVFNKRYRAAHRREYATSNSWVWAFAGITERVNRYAHIVEFGSLYQKAQPFMRPAWEANKVRTLTLIKRHLAVQLKKSLQRQAKRQAKRAAQGK